MKIKNFKLKIKHLQKGYTLIELLAVMVVLIVVGGIITSILISSLRGSNRSTSVNDVRQNGNYVLSQMSKMIAFAMTFQGISTDGTNYATDCVPAPAPPAGTPTPTPAAYSYIKVTSFDQGTTIFSCQTDPVTNQLLIASNGASMVDTSSVQVVNCFFTCSQANISTPPTLDINFTLAKNTSGLFVENNVSIPFETSITPRNANK